MCLRMLLLVKLAVHFAMNHINLWIVLLYAQSVQMTAVVVLIHAHVHPTVTMVHIDAFICTGLVLPLDHPDILIGVIRLR